MTATCHATPTISLAELETTGRGSGSGDERRYLCPICGPQHPQDAAHRSLAANLATGAWLCHRCGAKGLLAERQTRRTTTKPVGGRRLPPAPARAAPPPSEPTSPSPWAHIHLEPIPGTPGETYLASRGLPLPLPEGIDARWCERFGSAGHRGRPAVVFALRDASRRAVAIQGRFVDGRSPKCQSFGSVTAGLFSTPGALGSVVVVTEAPIDALSLAAAGVPAVATCGTRSAWPAWLGLAGRAVLLAQDSDEAGDRQAAALGHAARTAGAKARRLRPPAKDWAEAIATGGWAELHEALQAVLAPQSRPESHVPPAPPRAALRTPSEASVATEDAGIVAAFGHPRPADERGVARTYNPLPPEVVAELAKWGLTVASCDRCGVEDTLQRGHSTRRCRMTPNCKGRVRR